MDDLQRFEDAWDRAVVPEGRDGNFDVPDGTYDFEVTRAEIKTAKTSGKLMINIGHKITSGNHENLWFWNRMMLSADPERMGYVKRDLAYLGIEPQSLGDVRAALANLPGRLGTAKLVTKKGFQNVWYQTPSTSTETTNSNAYQPQDAPPIDDDYDIPF